MIQEIKNVNAGRITRRDIIKKIESLDKNGVLPGVNSIEDYYIYLLHLNNPIHKQKLRIGDEVNKLNNLTNPSLRAAITRNKLDRKEEEKVRDTFTTYTNFRNRQNGYYKKAFNSSKSETQGVTAMKHLIYGGYEKEIITLYGKMFTTGEILEICLSEYNLKGLKRFHLEDLRKQNEDEIYKMQEEHKRSFSDLRLSHTRSRLEELIWLFHNRKRLYQASKSGNDHRLLLQTLQQIKTEADVDVERLDGGLNSNLESALNEHIRKDIIKNLQIKEIIISRLCSKFNRNPFDIIKGLSESIYRKSIDNPEYAEEITFPSTQSYDFDKIKRFNEQQDVIKKLNADKLLEGKEERERVVSEQAADIREKLLDRLRKKNGDVNLARNSVNPQYEELMHTKLKS